MADPQLDIDFTTRARGTDPQTSHDAAACAGDFAHGHYALILGALATLDGTIYELAARTNLSHVQVARRLPEMRDAVPSKVRQTDRTRPGPSGRACVVWEAVR